MTIMVDKAPIKSRVKGAVIPTTASAVKEPAVALNVVATITLPMDKAAFHIEPNVVSIALVAQSIILIDVSEPLGVEGVFWNGAIHWLSDGVDFHCRFEVDTEKQIKPPSPAGPKILSIDKFRYFGECDGHLFLVQMQLCFAMGFKIL
ncbi:hypothetical protein ACSBR2_025317 [Camellia fascicularis]